MIVRCPEMNYDEVEDSIGITGCAVRMQELLPALSDGFRADPVQLAFWHNISRSLPEIARVNLLHGLVVYVCCAKVHMDAGQEHPVYIGEALWTECVYGEERVFFACLPEVDEDKVVEWAHLTAAHERSHLVCWRGTMRFVVAATTEAVLNRLGVAVELLRDR